MGTLESSRTNPNRPLTLPYETNSIERVEQLRSRCCAGCESVGRLFRHAQQRSTRRTIFEKIENVS